MRYAVIVVAGLLVSLAGDFARASDTVPQPAGETPTLFLSQAAIDPLKGDKAPQGSEASAAGAPPAKGEEGGNTEAMAKAAQNPIANMISVPFQNQMNFGVGRHDKMQNILNIQPVIPITLSEDWNLITRTIMPLIWQPELAPGVGPEAGLGDVQFSAFFSPAKSKGLTWGVGPVLQFPSDTDPLLGPGKFTAGPSFVGLMSNGPWLYGALVQNVWSYAGHSNRGRVNQFLLQPFVNYNFKGGFYLTSSPILTADWTADSDNRWTIPVGGGVGQIFKIGKMPVNLQVAGYYNVVTPDNGPEWQLRLQVQFLFPK